MILYVTVKTLESIDISVSGNAPFQYNWSNGSISEDLDNLYAGSYTITVTDVNTCTEVLSIDIIQPTPILLSVIAMDDTDPSPVVNTGNIDLTASGGSPGYTYDWDNNGPQNPDTDGEDLTNLAAGTYTVTVTDVNSCTNTISAVIYEPEICDDGIDNDGDGLADCLDIECVPSNPGIITASQDSLCVGLTGITYTINDVGAFAYVWTIPAGGIITAGQGTISITVDWINLQGGDLCVSSISEANCLSQANTCMTISIEDVPNSSQPITVTNGN